MTDDTPLTLREGEATLRVRVTALSARSSAGGTYRDAQGRTALVVRVAVPPEKGKANEAVIAILARSLKVPNRVSPSRPAWPTATRPWPSPAIRPNSNRPSGAS